MGKFVLTCCSTADASEEFYQERDIHYVCFHYFLDGKPYMDDMEKTMKLKDFYQAMIDGAETKTAQVNADEYCEFFETFLAEGQDIVHVTLSSGISGSYNSACIAKEIRMFGRYCRKSGIEIGIEIGKRKSLFHSSCAFLSDAVCLVPDVCGETDAIVYCTRKEKY